MVHKLAGYLCLGLVLTLLISMTLGTQNKIDQTQDYLLKTAKKTDKKTGKNKNTKNDKVAANDKRGKNRKKPATSKRRGNKPAASAGKVDLAVVMKKQTPKSLQKGWELTKNELTSLNRQNLDNLKEPIPPKLTQANRSHDHTASQIKKAAGEIDQIIRIALSKQGQRFNARTSDSQFVRRIYLDAAGRIPTEAEVLAFLKDRNSSKRQALIDDLLLREDYPMQMYNWAAEMMRVKDVNSLKGNTSGYQAWLMDQFTLNQTWDQTVFDLLTAEGNLVNNPATGWLTRDRGMPLDSLSNTLTTFMGANVACAQCHDHPFDDWSQRDFYELASFFGAVEVPDQDVRKISIKAFGQKNRAGSMMMSPSLARVKYKQDKHLTFPEDYAYKDVKPGSKVTPTFPVFEHLARQKGVSTKDQFANPRKHREIFASWMTHAENEQFAATIANRLWRKAFGRAVMEPLTEMDDLDQASNPALIRHLSKLMRELNYDIMAFQRVIYNTTSYQAKASIEPPMGEAYLYPGPLLRRMTAEQTWDSIMTLVKGDKVNEMKRRRKEIMSTYDVFKPGALDEITKANAMIYGDLVKAAIQASSEVTRKIKKNKAKASSMTFARASEQAQPAKADHFLAMFGQANKEVADGGTLEGGIPQVLMLMNGKADDLFGRSSTYVYKQVNRNRNMDAQLESMYLSFLARPPKSNEKSLLKKEKVSMQDLAWILLNTREFIFIQ